MTTFDRPQIDVNVPRFNQGAVALLTGTAFVTGWWPLVAVAWVGIAANRLLGPGYGPFTQVYRRLVRPRIRKAAATEWAAPPRFSQLLAVVFLGLAVVLFIAGLPTPAWVVTVMVTVLATLAAAARICVGCLLYEWVLAR